MTCAMDQRFDADSVADIQCTDPFRRIKLMAGDRQKIDAELPDIDGHFAY